MFHRAFVNWAVFGVTLILLISSTTAIKCYQCPDSDGIRGVCPHGSKGELKDCGLHNSCRYMEGSDGISKRFCCYLRPGTQSSANGGSCWESGGAIDCHCTEDRCNYKACKCDNGIPVKGTGVPVIGADGKGGVEKTLKVDADAKAGVEKSFQWDEATLFLAMSAMLSVCMRYF